jgi:hypothetical protein
MNERIKELAEQAGIRFTQLMSNPMVPVVDGKETDLEKLAELIIRECMACSIWVGKNNTNTVEPIHTAHAINQRIKQQLGVEEERKITTRVI